MNKLTICYHLQPDQDAHQFFEYAGPMRMEWADVFAERDAWEELARDMAALLERESVRNSGLLLNRLERMP
jgi:hypothetical protein